MPMIKIEGLEGLKRFSNLTPEEYRQWKRENSRYSIDDLTYSQKEELYNLTRIAKTVDKETFNKYSYDQLLNLEKQKIADYNNKKIRNFVYDKYNPYRADGTIDPNKGVGDEDTFYRIMGLEPMYQKEVAESGWMTGPEMNAHVSKKQKENFNMYSNPYMAGTETGAAAAASYFTWGKDADEKIDRGSNQNVIDKIFAKDRAAKAKKVNQDVDKVYKELRQTYKDVPAQKLFIKEINPVSGKNAGIPQLAAFYDKNGKVLSDEVNSLTPSEMLRWVAKKKVYEAQYGIGVAYDMLDKEAKDYINEHQDWMEYTAALGKDMAIGATAYTMDKINGVRAAYIQATEGKSKVQAFMDGNGHFWGKEYLMKDKNGNYVMEGKDTYIYVDPYSGEKIPVRKTMAQPSALDAQGIAPDGTTRGLFFNNRYWSDAEATGMLDRKDQARAKELNGYSPSKAVYKLGEDRDYVWEVAKMAQFAFADGLSNLVPSLGVWGGTAMVGSKLAQGVSMAGKVTKAVGKATYFTSKATQLANPTLGAIGIGHAYGRGVFGETLEGNMLMIDNKLYRDAEDKFSANYNEDNLFRSNVDNLVSQRLYEYLSENQDYINQLPDEERANFLSNLESNVRRGVVQEFVDADVNIAKQGEDYYKAVDEAADAATSAAATAAWTTGIKYTLVNNFGFRKFLFKDPFKRASSEASKVIEGATEGANKRLSITQRLANATKPEKLKELGKITASQMWGGGWTNFTDELQSAGARKINQDRMGRYLNGDYQAEAEAEMLGSMGTVLSYLAGAGNSLSDESTWSAGLVGALGSITSVAPNVASMASGRFRSEWAAINADANLSTTERNLRKLNLLVSNGVLNTYYDKVIGEKQAQDAIDKVNTILDNWEDFKALGRGLAIDKASMDVTNPHDADALNFVKSVQLVQALYEFSKENADSEVMLAAQRSSLFNEALNTVQKLSSNEESKGFSKILEKVGINKEAVQFTEQDAKNYLTEYYARNPQVPQSEENNANALKVISDNASKLRKGVEAFDAVNEAIGKIEKSSGKEVPIGVKVRLAERFALDQFLTDRIADVEEGISGKRSVTANRTTESYGSDKAIGKRIGSIDNITKSLEKEIEKARVDRDKKVKEAKDYKESRDNDLTSEETKKHEELTAEATAAELQLKALEESKRSLSLEKDALINMKGNERRILSSEEILSLSPEDRARMLDDNNRDDYSEAQKEEIIKARATLVMRDPQLLDDVQHQALMVQRRRVNSNAYSTMLQNPEAAAAQISANSESEYRKYKEAVKRRRESFVSSVIKALEEDPEASTSKVEKTLTEALMQTGIHPGIEILKDLRGSQVNNIKRYSYLFDRAISKLEMLSDVKNTLDNIKDLGETQRASLNGTIRGMVDKSTTREELLSELGKAVDPSISPEVSSSDRALLSNVLSSLEELWNQQSSTSSMTSEERQVAEDTFRREQLNSEEARLEAERQAAEEASKPDLSTEDSNDVRSQGEREAVENALEGVTEADMDTSNDRAAELASHGLTEQDLVTDNESSLTPEQVTEAVKEATNVKDEVLSPEQHAAAQPDKVQIIPTPKNDSTDYGNNLPSNSNEVTLLGNSMFRFDANALKHEGRQIPKVGNKPGDTMNRYYDWMDRAGINLQNIIDHELGEISKLNPKIFPVFVRNENNATDDAAMVDFPLLAVEYTPQVAKIHKDKNGGVIISNGKLYLIVGTLGFNKNIPSSSQAKNTIQNSSRPLSFFKSNPTERFFVNTSMYTQLQEGSLTAGRLVRLLATDSGVEIRSISELLADETRNPKGLALEDLKWGIQYDNRFAKVNVSDRNTVYPPSDGANLTGATFLLVETSNGNYIPAYIIPKRFSEIKDGKLKDTINQLFNELTSTDYSRRDKAAMKLHHYIHLSKEGDWILYGMENKATITIQRNGQNVSPTYDLADPNVNRGEVLAALEKILDPRINITTSALSEVTSLEMLDEAGALTTDIAMIGTSNASYNVYNIDANGTPIITAPMENKAPSTEVSSDLSKAQKKMDSQMIGDVTYRKNSEGNWETNTGNVVTDPTLIEQLNYRNLIRTRELKPDRVTGIDEIFVVNTDKDNPLVLIRKRGGRVTPMTKEGALKTINEINAEKVEKERQERLKAEIEKEKSNDKMLREMSESEKQRVASESNNDVDLGIDEVMTDEQIVGQMTGDYEVEATPQQKTAGELVDRVATDTSDIQLSEDGTHYIDSNGKKYARVTSVISADETSGEKFDPNSPWGLPSTTIGTSMDNFVRDFFDNKIGNLDNLSERYPNASNEQLQAFAKQLEGLKEEFNRRGLTIVPRDVTLTGTIEIIDNSGTKRVLDVAGTVDLLAYDRDGNFYIFDMKTNRSAPTGRFGKQKIDKWAKQLTLYKQLFQEKYGAVVRGIEVIPIQVDYAAPKGWGQATTEYTAKDGQLFANGEEFRSAEPILHNNISLQDTNLKIEYSKLSPAEQAMVRESESSDGVWSKAVELGFIKSGERPIGVIASNYSDSRDGGRLTPLQEKVVMKRVEAVLSNPNNDKTAMHDAIISNTHHTKANMPVLSFLYKVQEAVYNGQMTVGEALAMVSTLLNREEFSSTTVVKPEPVKVNEDINKTGSKSLAELQSKKTPDTALSIMRSTENGLGKRVRDLLKRKFPDLPNKPAELERFLQSKGINTTNIRDVEDWIKMIKECK